MKKEIKLFFDFEFTSLSTDAQPISLGIVSEDIKPKLTGNAIHDLCNPSFVKSFYAEFSDFDINCCDDWVKDNVVNKLKYTKDSGGIFHKLRNVEFGENYYYPDFECRGNANEIKSWLSKWVSQFSDYQIQFVCDCGTFDWYWMLQLLAEWETKKELVFTEVEHYLKPEHLRHEDELKLFLEAKGREIIRAVDKLPKVNMGIKPDVLSASIQDNSAYYIVSKTGLPKLPENISPVPQDLNDLIAYKKGMSVREAFDWNRLQFYFGLISGHSDSKKYEQAEREMKNIHNALFDANVIKAIYEKLK